MKLPCSLQAYTGGCCCPACNEHRQAVYAGKIPRLDPLQIAARIAHHREWGDLERLQPAPKTGWLEELRLRRLLWDLEDSLLEGQALLPATPLAR